MAHRFLSSFAAITILLLFTENAYATYEIVEIEKPFYVRSLAGEALDPTGAPVSGVEVSDCDQGFTKVITATRSDEKGRFILPVSGVSVHYLSFRALGFNPLRITVIIRNTAPKRLRIKLPIGG
ncbi:MAG: carboxypeptidase-like regulatory domain-containing protein [Terracidiphilus sp.]